MPSQGIHRILYFLPTQTAPNPMGQRLIWDGADESLMSHSKLEENVENETAEQATIEVKDLRKVFDVPSGTEVAVDGVNFSLQGGEFLTIVGPSGCGKTTTLRCIAGLEIPTSGTINFNGVDVTEVPANNRGLAMMFQNIALYPHMTIIDNISYPLKVNGIEKSERHEQAKEAAEIMQIPELLDKYPGELSGGQRQRAALARTIVQEPIAFLMDEPLSDLDAKLKIEIRKEIQRVHKRLNKPTIYVTHDQEEALTMSDRIAIMNDGHLEQIGTRDEVYNYPESMFVARFIGNPSINEISSTLECCNKENGEVTIYNKKFTFNTDLYNEEALPTDVITGIRPQSVVLSKSTKDAHFEGELLLLEPVDDRALARVDGPEGELRALIPSDNNLREGDIVGISFKTHNLYIFDDDSEELLVKSE